MLWRAAWPVKADCSWEYPSAAAGIFASLQVSERLPLRKGQEAVIVTILCDSGDKYLSERFWTEG